MPTIQEEIIRVKELMLGVSETQTIKECDDMGVDMVEKDHDSSYMAKQQLYNISKKAQSVHDRLGNDEELEDWVESKIAQMSSSIDSVTNSFDYNEHNDDKEEEIVTIDLGFSDPESNYSKIKKGYNFGSDGPIDSYIDPSDEYDTELGYELGEQDDGGGTGESDDGGGAGTASMGVWDSGITRGIANQVANSKWSDSYQTSRGKSNTFW